MSETISDICELIRTPRMSVFNSFPELADRIEAAAKAQAESRPECVNCRSVEAWKAKRQREINKELVDENARLRDALAKAEDQVRWTIAHIECGEYDDATGALYTAGSALEHITRGLKGGAQ